MNVGSLFSGIGGLDLGLERAGMRITWQVECDPYARAVLRKHWPAAALYDDVRSVGAANLAPVDLVCGGFPCQDISNAGKRVGIEGERSGLWSEYARIVRELRPSYVVVENVAALLARGLERVLGDLAACGYDAEWDCLPAAAFGAPHRRDRLFIVAHAAVDRDPQPEQDLPLNDQRQPPRRAEVPTDADRRDRARHVADAPRNGRKQGRQAARSGLGLAGDGGDPMADSIRSGLEGWASSVFAQGQRRADAGHPWETAGGIWRDGWWDAEPDVGRVAHGVPSRVDRLRCLGNAVVPQVAEYIGRAILVAEGGEAR